MTALADHDIPSLESAFQAWGFSPSHARAVLAEFYRTGGAPDFASLRVGKALLERMKQEIAPRRSELRHRAVSSDSTQKLLVGFPDGAAVESVLMPTPRPERAAGCVSSQVGCAMGCDFCASTRRGFQRNLDSGEIVEQFLHLRRAALDTGRRLHTLVFMGMGEPLLNFENVVAAIRRIAGEGLGALGWRQITVSTVGIVPGIEALCDADLNVHLAVSLHAPDDETRSRIVPTAKRYRVAEIMAAARRFEARTERIPTIEYCLLDGVNDSDAQAELLAELMDGFRAHLNLIPYNFIGSGLSGVVYRRPPQARLDRFLEIVRARGVVAHFRQTRGDDVNAACGQLREALAPPAPTPTPA